MSFGRRPVYVRCDRCGETTTSPSSVVDRRTRDEETLCPECVGEIVERIERRQERP